MDFVRWLRQGSQYALRMQGRNPGFSAVVLLSLALGIGANTAVFQLLDAVRLRQSARHESSGTRRRADQGWKRGNGNFARLRFGSDISALGRHTQPAAGILRSIRHGELSTHGGRGDRDTTGDHTVDERR